MSCWRIAPDGELHEAAIPAGAFHGQGIYETFLSSDCEPLLRAHLDRMRSGLEKLGISPPELSSDELLVVLGKALKSGELATFQRIRLTVFSTSTGTPSGIYLSGQASIGYSADQLQEGFKIAVCPWRRDPSFSLYEVKSISAAHNLEARRFAMEHDCDEGLLLSQESMILEGAFSNFFAVIGGCLITPPALGILPGITRATVLRFARESGIETEISELSIADVFKAAEEAFVTSSVIGVTPVKGIEMPRIAGRHLAVSGPVTRFLQERYQGYARG